MNNYTLMKFLRKKYPIDKIITEDGRILKVIKWEISNYGIWITFLILDGLEKGKYLVQMLDEETRTAYE